MDFDLQAFAESLMTGRAGAVVAIDPTDGGILAMVSKPDYDLRIFSGVTSPDLWRSLNADPATPSVQPRHAHALSSRARRSR